MLRQLLGPSVNAKAWYLWCFASYVSVGPFLNIFFQEKGLSKAQVGLIGALRPWTSAPASFAWAALADRLGAHRAVLLGAFVMACATRMLLLLQRSFGGFLAVVLLAETFNAPVGVLADAAVMQICEKESDYGKYRLWGAVGWGTFSTVAGWIIAHLGIQWSFYTQALLSVPSLFHGARLYATGKLTTHCPAAGGQSGTASQHANPEQHHPECLHHQHQHPTNEHQHQRLLENADSKAESSDDGHNPAEIEPLMPVQSETLKQYGISHCCTTAAAADTMKDGAVEGSVCVDLAAGEGQQERGHAGPSDVLVDGAGTGAGGGCSDASLSHWRRLWLLAQRSEVVVFFISATLMGYGFGTIESFLFLLLAQMGASETLMGLTLMVTCAAEIPAFHLQGRLLDRLGVDGVLDLVQAVYALRMALYAALPWMGSVLWVLPVEVLHGITFACGWGAGTVNCKLLAPPGLAATLQGAFQGLYFGAGYGIGSLIGGWVGSKLGWQGMFACSSAAMLLLWLLVLSARRLLRNRVNQPLQAVKLVTPPET